MSARYTFPTRPLTLSEATRTETLGVGSLSGRRTVQTLAPDRRPRGGQACGRRRETLCVAATATTHWEGAWVRAAVARRPQRAPPPPPVGALQAVYRNPHLAVLRSPRRRAAGALSNSQPPLGPRRAGAARVEATDDMSSRRAPWWAAALCFQ